MNAVEDKIQEIVNKYAPILETDINAAKRAYGIKHNRTGAPLRNRIKVRQRNGQTILSIGTNKGEIMSHKGKGKYPENRQEKPFINEPASKLISQMADELAVAVGNTIIARLIQ